MKFNPSVFLNKKCQVMWTKRSQKLEIPDLIDQWYQQMQLNVRFDLKKNKIALN